MGQLFFGRMFGFMETRSDYDGYIHSLDLLLPILCTAAILPVGTRTLWLMSGIVFPSVRKALPCVEKIDVAAKENVRKRQDLLETGKAGESKKDLLAKLFEVSSSKGAQEDFKLADIQQEAYVAL